MQNFWHPFEPLPLALWHGADCTFSFFLILAQHCLFFLFLIGSSSKGVRCTSIGSETFIFLSLNYVMKPTFLSLIVLIERFARKFGHHNARQNTAQGCKRHTFGRRAFGSKRLLSSLLNCRIISTCRTLYPRFSFSHLISQTCVKGKALEFVVSRSRASSSPLGFLHL